MTGLKWISKIEKLLLRIGALLGVLVTAFAVWHEYKNQHKKSYPPQVGVEYVLSGNKELDLALDWQKTYTGALLPVGIRIQNTGGEVIKNLVADFAMRKDSCVDLYIRNRDKSLVPKKTGMSGNVPIAEYKLRHGTLNPGESITLLEEMQAFLDPTTVHHYHNLPNEITLVLKDGTEAKMDPRYVDWVAEAELIVTVSGDNLPATSTVLRIVLGNDSYFDGRGLPYITVAGTKFIFHRSKPKKSDEELKQRHLIKVNNV
jgi:hypothetical protein